MQKTESGSGRESASDSDNGSKSGDSSSESNSAESGSASGSESDSGSPASASGSDFQPQKSNEQDELAKSNDTHKRVSHVNTITKAKYKSDSSRDWDKHPDIYGIRRSARSRKEPVRLSSTNLPDIEHDACKPLSSQRNMWNSDSSDSESNNSVGKRPPPSKSINRRAERKDKKRSKAKERRISESDNSSYGSDDRSAWKQD